MALVKMVRDFPEVKGGNTEAMIPEEAVDACLGNGWKIAEKGEKPNEDEKTEAKVEAVKVEEPKVEEPKAEVKTEEKVSKKKHIE